MDKVICLGKNYLEHAAELGDAVPEKPVLFLKPPSAVFSISNTTVKHPFLLKKDQGAIHHECEIVFRLSKDCLNTESFNGNWTDYIDAFGLGVDLTLRDVQARLKKNGHPWEISKSFLNSAVIGPWIPFSEFHKFKNESFSLSVNGSTRQKGNAEQMRMKIDEALGYILAHFPLCKGDVVFTGTPSGVGPLVESDAVALRWGSQYWFEFFCV